jgi:hydrogenase-4 component E
MMFPVPSTFAGSADVVAVLVLLTVFAMLRAPLLRSQIRLYAFQSLSVAVLAGIVAATRNIGDLYALAVFSFVLKVVVIPAIVLRLLRGTDVDLASSTSMGVASMVLIAIVVSGFGLFAIDSLHIHAKTLPTPALAIAVAVVLASFVLIILRSDVVSQAVGFFSMENGVSVASLVIAAKLPLMLELAFLFDLLVAVVVFGVLMRVHHVRARSLSTQELDRLRG